jgi:hypothetical protein
MCATLTYCCNDKRVISNNVEDLSCPSYAPLNNNNDLSDFGCCYVFESIPPPSSGSSVIDLIKCRTDAGSFIIKQVQHKSPPINMICDVAIVGSDNPLNLVIYPPNNHGDETIKRIGFGKFEDRYTPYPISNGVDGDI